MGEGKDQRFQDSWSQYDDHIKNSKDQLENINEDHGDNSINMSYDDHSSSSTSSLGDSTISNGSFSSLDTRDDASSSSPYSSFSNSTDSLYDLSELMTQLPIKRGISKFYDGKSESFTSLSSVTSIDDLKKKETRYKRKRKGSKSYQGGLDTYKSFTLPKPIITKKKTPRSSLSSSSLSTRRIMSPKPPQIPSQKDLRCRTFLQ